MKITITFIKVTKVIGPARPVTELIQQDYYSDADLFEIQVPDGYAVMSILRFLPDKHLTKTLTGN